MNNRFSSFDYVPSLIVGTVAALVIVQPAIAKTAKEVAQIAIPTTVQINNTLVADASGSGVIISKKGNTYTVLTANHVVNNPNSEFVIKTSKGKDHPVASVKTLQKEGSGPDLAIITFETSEEYSVAPISNSDEATIGSGIYISGYPLPATGSTEREYAFTGGQVTNIRSSNSEGYTMRYDAVTRRGMSGGPVFDVSGRVIGIHGQGDTVATVNNESAGRQEEVKTGLNSAIPINTFIALMPEVNVEKSAVKIDNKPPENVDAEKVDEAQVNNWFGSFAQDLIKDVIRNEVQRGLRQILPF
ncbi:S1 family peptidase [Planktothrix mougeotii]|uniref:Serine protease n=1 Tax=Planktothrix mougeotii LEGE 06226 TaxID=1828728 RepID=A0ABR9UK93_9CYAN|nr:serine protease [Planktothrix mougeotii]MBE9146890.1 trypsin-like peptidase domain-containing protein [Planktothrix mougeotii LEGE 06226]